MTRVCVFCGGSPLTREHVFPQWTRSLPVPADLLKLQLVPEPVRRVKTVLDEDGRYETVTEVLGGRKPLPTDVTVKVVCARCNNGWMSSLESDVRPVLTKMTTKRAMNLSLADQELLARWVFKTALMYAFWDPDASPFLPTTYRRFYRTRTMPPSAWAWVTRSESQWADMAMSMRNMRADVRLEPDQDERNNSTAMYLAVNGVAFLLHFSRSLAESYLALPDPWDRGWVRLHPHAERTQWPQRPMKERNLLTTVGMMGSVNDVTPGVDIEGLTPQEARQVGAAAFIDRLLEGSGYDPSDFPPND